MGKERMGEKKKQPAQGCDTEACRAFEQPRRRIAGEAVQGTTSGAQGEGSSYKYRDCG